MYPENEENSASFFVASASFKGIQALLNHGKKRFILENPKEQIQCKRTLYRISLCKPVKINARITAKSANFFLSLWGAYLK